MRWLLLSFLTPVRTIISILIIIIHHLYKYSMKDGIFKHCLSLSQPLSLFLEYLSVRMRALRQRYIRLDEAVKRYNDQNEINRLNMRLQVAAYIHREREWGRGAQK